MEVLIGTTNPSKVKRFADLLSGYDINFYTLKDLNITTEPNEAGRNPEENAILKAKFYSKYFDELSLNDKRQPGLNIRTPNDNERLADEEMIEYYSNLIQSLGGKVNAYYLDGIAVYNKGKITSFMDDGEITKTDSFYMVATPSEKRHEG